MRRWIALLMIAALLAGLCGCGADRSDPLTPAAIDQQIDTMLTTQKGDDRLLDTLYKQQPTQMPLWSSLISLLRLDGWQQLNAEPEHGVMQVRFTLKPGWQMYFYEQPYVLVEDLSGATARYAWYRFPFDFSESGASAYFGSVIVAVPGYTYSPVPLSPKYIDFESLF